MLSKLKGNSIYDLYHLTKFGAVSGPILKSISLFLSRTKLLSSISIIKKLATILDLCMIQVLDLRKKIAWSDILFKTKKQLWMTLERKVVLPNKLSYTNFQFHLSIISIVKVINIYWKIGTMISILIKWF